MLVPKEVNGVEKSALVVHATPSPGPREGKCFIFVATAFPFFSLQVYRHCWEPQEQSSSGWGEGSNPYLHPQLSKNAKNPIGVTLTYLFFFNVHPSFLTFLLSLCQDSQVQGTENLS